jgi:hypothetical protein
MSVHKFDIPKNANTLTLLTLDEFVQQPSTEAHLVGDIVPPKSIVIVFGPPKGGKTFSVGDMILHAAHGLDWHGHKVTKRLRVGWLVGEGSSGFRVRLKAWKEQHDSIEEPGEFRFLDEALSLPMRAPEVIEALREFAPDVVVTDTLNAYFGTGDENSTQDMTHFVNAVRQLRDELACTVIVIHHTGHMDQSRERGSIALRASADVIIQVAKDAGGSGHVGFQVAEARDIETWPQALALRLKRVDTEWKDVNGKPLATCIVEAADAHVTLAGRGKRLGKVQQILYAMCVEMARKQGPGVDGQALLVRADVADALKDMNINRQSVHGAFITLNTMGLVNLVEPGSVRIKLNGAGSVH